MKIKIETIKNPKSGAVYIHENLCDKSFFCVLEQAVREWEDSLENPTWKVSQMPPKKE